MGMGVGQRSRARQCFKHLEEHCNKAKDTGSTGAGGVAIGPRSALCILMGIAIGLGMPGAHGLG